MPTKNKKKQIYARNKFMAKKEIKKGKMVKIVSNLLAG